MDAKDNIVTATTTLQEMRWDMAVRNPQVEWSLSFGSAQTGSKAEASSSAFTSPG